MAKKIGGTTVAEVAPSTPATGTEQPKTKTKPVGMAPRTAFDLSTAVDAAGNSLAVKQEDGSVKLSGVPVNFNYQKHQPLAKTDFLSEAHYWSQKAEISQQFADRYIASAAKYRKMAENMGKFTNDKDRKRVAKLEKMRAEFLALKAELAKDGINLEDDAAAA